MYMQAAYTRSSQHEQCRSTNAALLINIRQNSEYFQQIVPLEESSFK